MKNNFVIVSILLIMILLVSCEDYRLKNIEDKKSDSVNEFWLVDEFGPGGEIDPSLYKFVYGETDFTFQLKSSCSWFDENYELTPEGQLVFSHIDTSDNKDLVSPVIINLSQDDIEFLAKYILVEHKFYRWVKSDGINVENYSGVRSNYEETVTSLTVSFNGETKVIGHYWHGMMPEEVNNLTDNKTVKEIYMLLKASKNKGRIVRTFQTSYH